MCQHHTLNCVSVQVLYAFLFGLTLFGDSISLLSMFGSVLIAGGIVASSISRDKPAPPQPSSDKQVGGLSLRLLRDDACMWAAASVAIPTRRACNRLEARLHRVS